MGADGVVLLGALFFGAVLGAGVQRFKRTRYDLRRTSNAVPYLRRSMLASGKDTLVLLVVAAAAAYAALHGK
ncbi:hypothetical protein [Actinocorallia longicatena]|uniref:Uncharacterized protein n=1 Tax=Actinocorallia longicatena TaxID=111803 RepID=A0ABP6QBY5_9ACTN